MNAILEQINFAGIVFVKFAALMQVQSAVLVVLLLLVDLLLRKKVRAVVRYWLWMLVLLKLVLPTTLSSPVSIGRFVGGPVAAINLDAQQYSSPTVIASEPKLDSLSAVPVDTQMAASSAELTRPAVSLTWQGAVLLLWLGVVCIMLLLLLQRAIFVAGLVAQAQNPPQLMNDTFSFCCRQMGIKNKISLKVSANTASPAVCGLFRPVILVPQNLAPALESNRLRTILFHELAHIKRGDLWINLAQTILQIIYFYNPLLWLANSIIRRVREQAVDEAVQVAMGENAPQYPQMLVDVAKMAFNRPVLSLRLIGVVESKSALKNRIERILSRPIPKTTKLGILGLIGLLIFAAVLLPMAEGTADTPEQETPGEQSVIQSKGEQIIKKMTEVNRYWLIGPPVEVKNYSYDFTLYQDEPHAYKVTEPSSVDRTARQGITYNSILHKLAKEPDAATYTAVDQVDGSIRIDFKLTDAGVSIGNGIEKGWRGYFSRKIEEGEIWLDAQKTVPVRAECNELYEYFSDYTAIDETHYVPLRIKIDNDKMHFDWSFKLHKPGLWLFDKSHYLYDDEQEPIIAASICNVRINGKLSDQSPVVDRDANKPRVISVWPQDGATEVEPVTEIRIRFDRPMNPAQTNLGWKEGRYLNLGTVRYDGQSQEFVIPVELEPGCKHRIIANEWTPFRSGRQQGFVSVDGFDAEEFEWSFSTKGTVVAADAPKPKVVSVNPVSGSRIAMVSELKIVFDQPITTRGLKLGLPGTEAKSLWREPQVFRQNVRYNTDKTEIAVPLVLAPDWNGSIELSGFVSEAGAEAEPIVLEYLTERELFSPGLLQRLNDAAKSQELINVLEAVRNTRLNIKSLSETVQTVGNFGKESRTKRAIFKMQGDRQFFVDITDQWGIGTPFIVGSDGQDCWFYYYKGEKEGLVTVPFEQVHEKTVSICDFTELSKLEVSDAINKYKLEYVGEDTLDGYKCHLIRSWYVNLESDYVKCKVRVGCIDAQTNLLMQAIDDSGFMSTICRFYYDRVNEKIPDSEFSPKAFTDIKPSEPEPLNDKYDTRLIRIKDGSSGTMQVSWGMRGPGGESSSGLN